MNNKNYSKKQRKIQLNLEKNKINTEVFNVVQKVRESICISILDDSIFAKIQPLNKYSKGIKKEMCLSKDWLYIQGWIIVK